MERAMPIRRCFFGTSKSSETKGACRVRVREQLAIGDRVGPGAHEKTAAAGCHWHPASEKCRKRLRVVWLASCLKEGAACWILLNGSCVPTSHWRHASGTQTKKNAVAEWISDGGSGFVTNERASYRVQVPPMQGHEAVSGDSPWHWPLHSPWQSPGHSSVLSLSKLTSELPHFEPSHLGPLHFDSCSTGVSADAGVTPPSRSSRSSRAASLC